METTAILKFQTIKKRVTNNLPNHELGELNRGVVIMGKTKYTEK